MTAGLDDTTIDKIASIFGEGVESEETSTDAVDSDGDGEVDIASGEEPDHEATTENEEEFIGTYHLFANTCYDFDIVNNVRIYETEDAVLFYDTTDELYIDAEKSLEDSTLAMTIDGSFGNDDLDCLCGVDTDGTISCSCENTETNCAIIWGAL